MAKAKAVHGYLGNLWLNTDLNNLRAHCYVWVNRHDKQWKERLSTLAVIIVTCQVSRGISNQNLGICTNLEDHTYYVPVQQ